MEESLAAKQGHIIPGLAISGVHGLVSRARL